VLESLFPDFDEFEGGRISFWAWMFGFDDTCLMIRRKRRMQTFFKISSFVYWLFQQLRPSNFFLWSYNSTKKKSCHLLTIKIGGSDGVITLEPKISCEK